MKKRAVMAAFSALMNLARAAAVAYSLYLAVTIRLFAVINYGRVIHEFDPWFNYRATEYMVEHGWDAFQAWYDTKSWYPLGRHVGSTTYPGLQLTSWAIYEVGRRIDPALTVNDVCVLLPAGFGAIATAFTGLLCWECTRDANSAVAATFFMAILPAHLMRSVAGGYDNESLAISVIVATFFFWVRALRSASSWPFGILAGLTYICMVAAWGGYVFVLNLVGLHALALVLCGRYSPQLHKAYSCWYIIGTAGAVLGPARYLVGWQPFQSMEQLGPLGVFGGLQLIWLCELIRARRERPYNDAELLALRAKVFGVAAVLAAIGIMSLPPGFFGPLSARVRGLFIKHTKTGNPLVDSVAEHQATPLSIYWQYYHLCAMLGVAGFFFNCFQVRHTECPHWEIRPSSLGDQAELTGRSGRDLRWPPFQLLPKRILTLPGRSDRDLRWPPFQLLPKRIITLPAGLPNPHAPPRARDGAPSLTNSESHASPRARDGAPCADDGREALHYRLLSGGRVLFFEDDPAGAPALPRCMRQLRRLYRRFSPDLARRARRDQLGRRDCHRDCHRCWCNRAHRLVFECAQEIGRRRRRRRHQPKSKKGDQRG